MDKVGVQTIERETVEGALREYLRNLNYKRKIAEAYLESKNWGEAFSSHVDFCEQGTQESFIDCVETVYQTNVRNGKHLQELTGITYIDSWDSKAGRYITQQTATEAKENALRVLNETVIGSRYSKYFRALEKALEKGAKYKDLLQIKPEDYKLPQDWRGCLGSDQYSSILWALSFKFRICQAGEGTDLRGIAQEIEAPYPVLIDCYKLSKLIYFR